MSGAWQDARTSGGSRYYQPPTAETTNWRAPGHDRMFNSHDWDETDRPGRAFTTRKRHGWWGREEYFDAQGRRIG